MARLPDAAVGDARRSQRAWETLTDLVNVGNRMAGQVGEREAAGVLETAFEAAGLDGVEIDEFPIPGWWRGSSRLAVEGRGTWTADHEVIALPGSPADTVTAPLIDLGYGLPEDIGEEVDGNIVMVRSDAPEDARWAHRMEKFAAAYEHGAVGFIYRNHVSGCLPATGECGYHRRPALLPAVGVSHELGARLARYAADDEAETTLEVDCRHEETTSQNVHATVGPATDEEVLVTAHVDAHDIAEGAEDDGVGAAALPEIGRLLRTVADRLDTRVRLIGLGAEEIGLYGAYHVTESHDRPIKAVINIDGAGSSRDPRITTFGFPGLADPFDRAAEQLSMPLDVSERVSPHADSWAFVERGVPTVTLGSQRPAEGRGWGHTHADTLEKLDPRDVQELVLFATAATVAVAEESWSPELRTPEDIRDELTDGHVRELEIGDRWHFE